MSTKSLLVVSVISFAAISLLQAQSPTPAESPSAEKKHRTHKKSEAAASPAQSPTTASAAESPAASPKAKRTRKAKAEAAASPAASAAASASPAKKTLADFFKPQTSASAAPTAANTAPAKGTRAVAAANAAPAPGGGPGLVWVNTDSHVYHKEGSRFYGKTKKGKYVSEADAIKEGDKPAKRE
jgi:membrane protein involved in colicin uptake